MRLLLSLESLLLPHDLLHAVLLPLACKPCLVRGHTGSVLTLCMYKGSKEDDGDTRERKL